MKEVEIQIPRRNYRTRTYSGGNLLSGDKLDGISKAISEYTDNLFWSRRENLLAFPPLEHINQKIQLQLMDIIMGDDALGEGWHRNTDKVEEAFRLSLLNAKKNQMVLQERSNLINEAY